MKAFLPKWNLSTLISSTAVMIMMKTVPPSLDRWATFCSNRAKLAPTKRTGHTSRDRVYQRSDRDVQTRLINERGPHSRSVALLAPLLRRVAVKCARAPSQVSSINDKDIHTCKSCLWPLGALGACGQYQRVFNLFCACMERDKAGTVLQDFSSIIKSQVC